MSAMPCAQPGRHPRLGVYGLAAGSLAVLPAQAAQFDFDPPGGLPIVVDTTNTLADAPVDIDLDADGIADFRFFYTTDYGGGFAVSSIADTVDFSLSPRIMVNPKCCYGFRWAYRLDEGEFVHPDFFGSQYASEFQVISDQFPSTVVDAPASAQSGAAFTPFRDRPGFLGVSLGVAATDGDAGFIRIVVNAAGTELQILGGSWRDDNFDAQILPDTVFEGGFEPITSGWFSTVGALGALAAGAEEE